MFAQKRVRFAPRYSMSGIGPIILLKFSHTITEVIHSPDCSDGSLTRPRNIALKPELVFSTTLWCLKQQMNLMWIVDGLSHVLRVAYVHISTERTLARLIIGYRKI